MALDEIVDRNRVERAETAKWLAMLAGALVVWAALYSQLIPFSEWVVSLLPVERKSHLGEAIQFFVYDTPKVLLLLVLVIFGVGVVRSFFSPEKTRAILAGRREFWAYPIATLLGVVTPFCSCSSVPLFIGFVTAGVPLGVTFSFLIAGPMVGPIQLVLLWGLVGWKVALLYLLFGAAIAAVAGWVIGQFRLERWLEPWVRELRANGVALVEVEPSLVDRLRSGVESVKEIVGQVWLWVVAGIAIGALIHGYVPADLMARVMGADAWWSVPAAVLLGIPMYTNAAGVIPIVEALLGKGAALGTTLAFMMSVIALSLPEMIILRKVLSVKLIAVFVGVVAIGILAVGFLFNALFH